MKRICLAVVMITLTWFLAPAHAAYWGTPTGGFGIAPVGNPPGPGGATGTGPDRSVEDGRG